MSITIKDIARESGYAVGTVSRVLNNSPDVSDTARAKVMAVVEKYNFKLNNNAKHLKQQAGNGIALIVKGSQNMLFASLVEQLQPMIREKGFECLIYYINETDNELENALTVCKERRPKGIMFLGSNLRYFDDRFAQVKVPCVLVTNSARELNYKNLSSVSTDDSAAAQAAVEYLLEKGHRNIGILSGKLDSSRAAFIRMIGCRNAFEKYNVPFVLENQCEQSLFSIEEGYSAMNKLLDRNHDITAVFVMSDMMAIGANRAIHDRGLSVPQDISIVGFDGIDLVNYLSPKLTTIGQNKEKIAAKSVEILMDSIYRKKEAVYEIIPFRIIDGESTKRL